MSLYDLRVRRLAGDLAFAAYWMRTDMSLVFSPKPFGSDNREFFQKTTGRKYPG